MHICPYIPQNPCSKSKTSSYNHISSSLLGQTTHELVVSLNLVSLEVPTPDHFDRLFSALRRSSSAAALRTITLFPDVQDSGYEKTHAVNPNSISLLFPFQNLEDLLIGTATSFKHIDNALIKDMANAWPRLKYLRLYHFPDSELTKVTVFGLLPLANCAYLESLEITLDSAIPDTGKADGTFHDGSLSCLAVGKSAIKDPEAVAAFLSNVLPNLMDIEAWGNENGYAPEEGTDAELWQQVWKNYLMLVKVRRQENLAPRAHGMD